MFVLYVPTTLAFCHKKLHFVLHILCLYISWAIHFFSPPPFCLSFQLQNEAAPEGPYS